MKKVTKEHKNINFKLHVILTILVTIILSFSLQTEVNANNDENNYTLPVFETTDIHGYIAEKTEIIIIICYHTFPTK